MGPVRSEFSVLKNFVAALANGCLDRLKYEDAGLSASRRFIIFDISGDIVWQLIDL